MLFISYVYVISYLYSQLYIGHLFSDMFLPDLNEGFFENFSLHGDAVKPGSHFQFCLLLENFIWSKVIKIL